MRKEKFPLGLLVFLGGGCGACTRWLLTFLLPFSSVEVTCGINVVGAFCLGFLLAFLAARSLGTASGAESATQKAIRLTLGAGFLGGFTTYSAFAVQSIDLLQDAATFFLYFSATLLLGLLACFAGNFLGGRIAELTMEERA